jgi:hypothetical protein
MPENFKSYEAYPNYYLFGSRALTHITFWLSYYVLFSLVWFKADSGYFASFYLEFILLPVRMLAAYCMIYFLIPQYLIKKQFKQFFSGYLILLILAGVLQRLFSYFFYEQLLLQQVNDLINFSGLSRSILLINSTVIFVGAAKIFQLHMKLLDNQNFKSQIEVRSNRRTYRINTNEILYIEGLGNYITYYLQYKKELIVYSTIKKCLVDLPAQFLRVHRSYIINVNHIESYNNENVIINNISIPRSKEITDEMLRKV